MSRSDAIAPCPSARKLCIIVTGRESGRTTLSSGCGCWSSDGSSPGVSVLVVEDGSAESPGSRSSPVSAMCTPHGLDDRR
eukprot:scaffold81103_cov28-Tisochrysis_lutea.AAC.2